MTNKEVIVKVAITEVGRGGAHLLPPPYFFPFTCLFFFAITLKHYKLCHLKLN